MLNKTYIQKPAEVKRAKHVIDAQGKILGQVATEVATLLIGKHKPTFTPHVDGGDFVVVINAKDVVVTGNKPLDKLYYTHSGFPGGIHSQTFGEVMAKYPDRVIRKAVFSMLPDNKLKRLRINRLKVFAEVQIIKGIQTKKEAN
jgi:large subunit ribosomal protein L13